MAFDLALTSMAQMPSIIGGRERSVRADRSEYDPLGEGVADLVPRIEWYLGENVSLSGDLNRLLTRVFLSQGIVNGLTREGESARGVCRKQGEVSDGHSEEKARLLP